jgi:hypothetical protein
MIDENSSCTEIHRIKMKISCIFFFFTFRTPSIVNPFPQPEILKLAATIAGLLTIW